MYAKTSKLSPDFAFADALRMDSREARSLLDHVKNETDDMDFFIDNQKDTYSNARARRMWAIADLEEAIGIFDRLEAKQRTYDLYYIVKANRHKYLCCDTVVAGNLKDAKTIHTYAIMPSRHHNAFTVTNGKFPKGWNWDYICEHLGMTPLELAEKAKNPFGICFE